MRRPFIILPLLIIFVCAALYIAVIPGREWYSQITQRPRIARYAAALGVGPEQHLVTGTKTVWDSPIVVEHGFYLIPRSTDFSSFNTRLAEFGLPESISTHGADLPDALRWVAGTNGLSSSIEPQNSTPTSQSLLYFYRQSYGNSGTISV